MPAALRNNKHDLVADYLPLIRRRDPSIVQYEGCTVIYAKKENQPEDDEDDDHEMTEEEKNEYMNDQKDMLIIWVIFFGSFEGVFILVCSISCLLRWNYMRSKLKQLQSQRRPQPEMSELVLAPVEGQVQNDTDSYQEYLRMERQFLERGSDE